MTLLDTGTWVRPLRLSYPLWPRAQRRQASAATRQSTWTLNMPPRRCTDIATGKDGALCPGLDLSFGVGGMSRTRLPCMGARAANERLSEMGQPPWSHTYATLFPWRNALEPSTSANAPQALVAQGIEHRFPKPGVARSNRAGGTTTHRVSECVGHSLTCFVLMAEPRNASTSGNARSTLKALARAAQECG